MRTPEDWDVGTVLPKLEGPPTGLGREMCGFIVVCKALDVAEMLSLPELRRLPR